MNNKAQSEMSQGLLKDAQESFFALLRSGQRTMEAHLGLTELYQASGNITAALKHYDEIFKVGECVSCWLQCGCLLVILLPSLLLLC
jgi:hypothetical protein